MQRFNPGKTRLTMVEDDIGDYVNYEDSQALIDELSSIIKWHKGMCLCKQLSPNDQKILHNLADLIIQKDRQINNLLEGLNHRIKESNKKDK